MKFDQLMHFLEAARREHIGNAAAALKISPSGISYSIECLEEDLGVTLFKKRGKRIFLTDAGKRLLQKIPEVQHQLSDLRSFVTSAPPPFQGHLRLGASHVLADNLLAPLVGKSFHKSPQLSVALYSLRSSEVLSKTLEDQLDLGILFSPQPHPRLECQRIYEGQLKAFVRPKHPLLKQKDPLKALAVYPAVLPKAFGGIDVCESHPVFERHGIKPNARFSYDNYAVATAIVRHSDVWGFFPDWLATLPHFALKALPLPSSWDAPFHISAIWLKDLFLETTVRHLIDRLHP